MCDSVLRFLRKMFSTLVQFVGDKQIMAMLKFMLLSRTDKTLDCSKS